MVKTVIKYLITLIIGIFLLWYLLNQQSPENLDKIKEAFFNADYSWIAITIFISLVEKVSRAYRWNLLMEPVSHTPPLKNTLIAVMVGYFANIFLPRMEEVARCGILKKTDNIPVNISFGTVIAERAIDFLCLLILIALSLFIEFKKISELLSRTFGAKLVSLKNLLLQNYWIIILAITILAALILFVYSKRETLKKNSFFTKVNDFIVGVMVSLLSIRKLKKKKEFIFHTLFIWTCYFFMTYLAFFSLPATSNLGISSALVILVVGGLGMSAPVQAGIGAFHFFVQQTLEEVYKVEPGEALSYAFLVHTSQTATVLVFGLVCFIISVNLSKKLKLKEEEYAKR